MWARNPSGTNLDSEHKKVAARRARKLEVGVATLTPRCLLEREAGLTVSSWPRLAGASDRADAGGVDSKLSPTTHRTHHPPHHRTHHPPALNLKAKSLNSPDPFNPQ